MLPGKPTIAKPHEPLVVIGWWGYYEVINLIPVVVPSGSSSFVMTRRNRGMTENTNEMKKWRGKVERVQLKFEQATNSSALISAGNVPLQDHYVQEYKHFNYYYTQGTPKCQHLAGSKAEASVILYLHTLFYHLCYTSMIYDFKFIYKNAHNHSNILQKRHNTTNDMKTQDTTLPQNSGLFGQKAVRMLTTVNSTVP